jgi:hypothetical protein
LRSVFLIGSGLFALIAVILFFLGRKHGSSL